MKNELIGWQNIVKNMSIIYNLFVKIKGGTTNE